MINITDIEVNNHKLWSPKNPFIYDIKIILEKAEIVQNDTIYYKLDEVNEKFGFREFTVKKNKFYLNNEPIYLKAVFFEGLYPVKLSYPDSKEMIKQNTAKVPTVENRVIFFILFLFLNGFSINFQLKKEIMKDKKYIPIFVKSFISTAKNLQIINIGKCQR